MTEKYTIKEFVEGVNVTMPAARQIFEMVLNGQIDNRPMSEWPQMKGAAATAIKCIDACKDMPDPARIAELLATERRCDKTIAAAERSVEGAVDKLAKESERREAAENRLAGLVGALDEYKSKCFTAADDIGLVMPARYAYEDVAKYMKRILADHPAPDHSGDANEKIGEGHE